MSVLRIQGAARLTGSIPVFGSKNASLPLIAASMLTNEPVTLQNIPPILDVHAMVRILTATGADVSQEGTSITVSTSSSNPDNISSEAIGSLRGSILLLGALLGRERRVRLPRPGGDIIGQRPIDVHLDAFRQLGASVKETNAMVEIDGSRMRAGSVILSEFSVTATENVLLVAATLPGTTTIHIAAAEPHVSALARMLTAMGAQIEGIGTHTLTVTGNDRLTGTTFTNIPDMLEAGFFILLAAATKSALRIEGVPLEDLHLFFKKLDDIGVRYTTSGNTVTTTPAPLRAFRMQSLPHPGIPTDLQAPFAVIATQAQGSSLIHDPLYEDRFKHITELQKMGADAVICDPHRVIINGPTKLTGQRIPSLDIRAGATLVMAGLVAEGETVIEQAEIIDRGYVDLDGRLRAVGADIIRQPYHGTHPKNRD